MNKKVISIFTVTLLTCSSLFAATLSVGPGKDFGKIEDALKRARPGDTVKVYPLKDNEPYKGTAVFLSTPKISIIAVPAKGRGYVPVSGAGVEYSGAGSVPRAIFQFNKGADGCVLEGIELFGASNKSYNGAGVRINEANDVTISHCYIHDNDMGAMANGHLKSKTASNQLFESCRFEKNGNANDPGMNHNLYLGGTSVTLRYCDVSNSLTGHNVKSRAHYTRVEYSYIHHSANREFDLVDEGENTAAPESHAVLIGNIIVKDPECKGNRHTIHFGEDGGHGHDGTLYLIHNTIVTPFRSAVITLSSEKAKAEVIGNILVGSERKGESAIADTGKLGSVASVAGSHNWFTTGFDRQDKVMIDWKTCAWGAKPAFKDEKSGDYQLVGKVKGISGAGADIKTVKIPQTLGAKDVKPMSTQYSSPLAGQKRKDGKHPTLGACE
ncbi:MAG: right-handed parallel beta-helix repeat-containing protein [Planctomycetes bacterium]|nr:right-handed parallel beta-helix repeat-containing protein [Planctomycetota bacterium]